MVGKNVNIPEDIIIELEYEHMGGVSTRILVQIDEEKAVFVNEYHQPAALRRVPEEAKEKAEEHGVEIISADECPEFEINSTK